LIAFSPTARRQITELRLHYEGLERPAAIRYLIAAIRDAAIRIERTPDRGSPAPRPYPTLIRPGLRWLKAGRYWFAYVATEDGAIVSGVFHESADIPNRI
jgi:plasmid stabilization system protein ParE